MKSLEVAGAKSLRGPFLKCDQLTTPNVAKYCQENTKGVEVGSKRYRNLLRLFSEASRAEKQQQQERSLEHSETNSSLYKNVCQSLSTRVAKFSCEADMFVAEGNARLLHSLSKLSQQIEKTALKVERQVTEMSNPNITESSNMRISLTADTEDLCRDNNDVVTLESACREAGAILGRYGLNVHAIAVYTQTARGHIESFNNKVFAEFSDKVDKERKKVWRTLTKFQ